MNATERTVTSAADLLPLIELTAITTYEVAGRRAARDDGVDQSDDIQVMVRVEGDDLETRARMYVVTQQAELVADVSATYSLREALEIPEAVVAEFVERVGVMAVFPYLREAIHTTATRLGVDAPVLGLLRAGNFKLNADNPASPEPDTD
jgi:hypothetical protein